MTSRSSLVTGLAIAEFDVIRGCVLSHRVPSSFSVPGFTDEQLANLALPDGAHIHTEDWSYIIFDVTSEDAAPEAPRKILYGLALYRKTPDPNAARGAIQKSILLFSEHPYFPLFLSLLRLAHKQLLKRQGDGQAIINSLFKELGSQLQDNMELRLWGENQPINIPVLKEDEFAGASLSDLVVKFRDDTMFLWYALLLERRILVSGQPAHVVGNVCLAAPLLVSPLTGFTHKLVPYVALTNMAPITGKKNGGFVAGTTNMIFQTKTAWYDVLVSLESGTINVPGIRRVPGTDSTFIKSVLGGIADGKHEVWVREQFRQHTLAFLRALQQGKLRQLQKTRLSSFVNTSLYKRYLAQEASIQTAKPKERSEFELLRSIEVDLKNMSVLDKTRTFYDLIQAIKHSSVQEIDGIVNANGVSIVAPYLKAPSHQVRKYAYNVIAVLAITVRGQVRILTDPEILPGVLKCVADDPMPNVSSAACLCILKIAQLFIGVRALMKLDVIDVLYKVLQSDRENLELKTRAAATLLRIYRFLPDAKKIPVDLLRKEVTSVDSRYTVILYRLLDAMGVTEVQPPIPIGAKMKAHLIALSSEDAHTSAQATSFLLSDLVERSDMVLQLVASQGVSQLLVNERKKLPENKLSRLSWAVLAIVCDTTAGREQLLKHHVIARALASLKIAVDPLYLFYCARFIEVACQHYNSCQQLISSNGIEALVKFILQYIKKDHLNSLVLPAIGALRHLALSVPSCRVDQAAEQVLAFTVEPAHRDTTLAQHDEEVQSLLADLSATAKATAGGDAGGDS